MVKIVQVVLILLLTDTNDEAEQFSANSALPHPHPTPDLEEASCDFATSPDEWQIMAPPVISQSCHS